MRGAEIGIVFQSFHLVPTMTALENVALPLGVRRHRRRLRDRRASCLHEVGLGHRVDHFPAQLSGGEQQRVALARALSAAAASSSSPTSRPAISTARPARHVIDLLFGLQRRREATLDPRHPRRAPGRRRASARSAWPTGASTVDRRRWPRDGTAERARGRRAQRANGGCRCCSASPLRELRSGLTGFYIFIACVALGVMVITGVGALSDALRAGFERQGEAILGGDVTLARTHARAEGDERDWHRRARAASARPPPCAPWRGGPTARTRRWSS